jgi:hypothetical protein
METELVRVDIGTRQAPLYKVLGSDAEALKTILRTLSDNPTGSLPGPLPSSIDSSHFSVLKQRSAYWVAEKTDEIGRAHV